MNTLIYHIAKNCQWLKTVNKAFMDNCTDNLDKCEENLPHGSGFDVGCKIDREGSGIYGVVIKFDFHHMDEFGGYDGWESYEVNVIPSLMGFELSIKGNDRDNMKDYFIDTFNDYLSREIQF